jgi:non-heme chloroperoxidase
MARITEYETEQLQRANATGLTPVVFVHGLWLLPSSWDRWAEVFEEAGYTALTPGWPDDPRTVEEANAKPEVFAHKTVGQVADHSSPARRTTRCRGRSRTPPTRNRRATRE